MSQGVDWQATGTMIGALGTWVGAISIIFAALLGRDAIADFREQKLTERRIDFAEKLLFQMRSVNDAIFRIRQRHPTLVEKEDASRILLIEKFGSKQKRDDALDATISRERLKKESAVFDDLRALIPLAEAYFGTDVSKQARRFLRIPPMITNHANRLWNVGHDPGVDSTLYFTGSKQDTIAHELQKSSEELENILIAHLKPKSRHA